MNRQKKKLIFCVAVIIFLSVYFLIKTQGPAIVEAAYRGGDIDTLNKITHSSKTQSLDFYLGRMQEALWGPLTELISGMLFLGFCLVYLKASGARIFGLAVFLYLLITKFEVLFYPPYGDAI